MMPFLASQPKVFLDISVFTDEAKLHTLPKLADP